MAFNINDFYGALQYGGARPSLFECNVVWPNGTLPDLNFLCRAAQIPAATVNVVEQTYFGRALKFAGNRSFEDWNVTIINDEDYKVRDGFEKWSDGLNGFESNVRRANLLSTNQYKGTGTIIHYGKTGSPIRTYEIRGLLPAQVAAMQMDWSTDEIQTFDVTFAMDYWVALPTGAQVSSAAQVQQQVSSDQAGG
tara:strand:- start:7936 stop:8517 length:582 start_codon:yes stop_codon:yes gene_type:complete